MNFSYYIVFGIIVILAGLNLISLYWVTSLQKRLKEAATARAAEASKNPANEAHTVLVAEELLRLENVAKGDIQNALVQVSHNFQDDLANTSKKINTKVEEMADKVVQDELTKYQGTFDELRQAAIETLSRVQAAIEEQSRKKAEDVSVLVEAEKKKVIEKFEQKLGDIVAGYLVEVLGSNVDLGAQRGYLFATLEAHKDELKKAVIDGP